MPDGRPFTVTKVTVKPTTSGWVGSKLDPPRPKAVKPLRLARTVDAPPGPKVPSAAELKRLCTTAFRNADCDKRTFLEALDALVRTLRLLDDTTLADLMWRGQQVPGRDGYTSSPQEERVDGGGGDTRLNSVESAVEGRMFGKVTMVDGSPVGSPPQALRDLAGIAVAELQGALWACYQHVATIDRTRDYLLGIHSYAKGRDNSIEVCAGCGGQILGKLHRVNNEPFHDGAEYDSEGIKVHEDCYQLIKRQRQRERRDGAFDESASMDDHMTTATNDGESQVIGVDG